MSLTEIAKFEKMNNLSVNVYGLTDTNKVQILKIQTTIKTMKHTLTFSTLFQRKNHIMLSSKIYQD